MTSISQTHEPLTIFRRWGMRPLVVLAAAAFVSAVVLRLVLFVERPLWLDETFTGAIAAEPTLGGVLRQTLLDVNAPGYYFLAHFWASLFSLSNDSLRMPSLLLGLAAPLLTLIRTPGLGWRARLIWFASIALWGSAASYSNEARCYSLLYFCGVANTVAFMRLLGNIRPGPVLLWGLSAAAMILVHYVAVFLIAAQGVILLWQVRGRFWTLWAAVIPLAPTALWLLVHLTRIREFAQENVAWYPYLTSEYLPGIAIAIFGAAPFLCITFFAGVLIFERNNAPAPVEEDERWSDIKPWLAVAAGIGGVVVFVIVAFIRPSFTPRYLFVFAPACLLLLPLLCERIAARLPAAPAICLALITAQGWYTGLAYDMRFDYQYETGAQFLIKSGARKVAFLWDSPANQVEAPEQIQKVGGFFFDRAGAKIDTTPVRLPLSADPMIELAKMATTPDSGFIWVYDVNVRHTAAARRLPRFADVTRDFDCQRSGLFYENELMVGALSCIRKAPSSVGSLPEPARGG